MTEQEFENWIIDVQCSLFHVMKTDMDDEHGVRYDQLMVLGSINQNPKVLKHRTLRELLEMFGVLD